MRMSSASGARIFVEVGDFIRYFQGSFTPTGICRVQEQIFPALLRAHPGRVSFCRIGRGAGEVEILDLSEILGMADVGDLLDRHGGRWTLPLLKMLRWTGSTARQSLRQRSLKRESTFGREVAAGDVLLSLGSPWEHRDFARKVAALKAAHGMRFALLVHDVLPVSHPQFVDARRVPVFREWLRQMADVWDVVLTPSRSSMAALRRHIEEAGLAAPEAIHPIPFGAGFGVAEHSQGAHTPLSARRHVLFVSTIEIRKNHLLLVRIWERLAALHGLERIPDLVFAGKWGWEIAPLRRALAANNRLGGKIRIVQDVSDAALAGLYRDARFTLFPSHCEGWGLPVSESLYFGRYCIASDATSIPEAGGDLVDHHGPEDIEAAYRLVERAILDDEFLTHRERRIEEGYWPASWLRTAERIVELLARQNGDRPPRTNPADSASALVGQL